MPDISSIIPAMYAQEKGPLSKAVILAATNPETEKQFLEDVANSVLKKDSEQLNEPDNIGEKEGEDGGGFFYFNANNETEEHKKDANQENPLVGNLLNVKI